MSYEDIEKLVKLVAEEEAWFRQIDRQPTPGAEALSVYSCRKEKLLALREELQEAYRKLESHEGTFGWTLQRLYEGKAIKRKGQRISYVRVHVNGIPQIHPKDGKYIWPAAWCPSQEDLFASDWEAIDAANSDADEVPAPSLL